MNLRYNRQGNCPSEEQLLAYQNRRLIGEDHEALMFHLLFCDACPEFLRQISTDIETQTPSSDNSHQDSIAPTPITNKLAEAINRFSQIATRVGGAQVKTLKELNKEGGVKVGQIWRPRFKNIVVPGTDEQDISATGFNSVPHLVVITTVEPLLKQGQARNDYHPVGIAPISGDLEYAGEGDLVVHDQNSPLGYSFMIETWNVQTMLLENLDCCIAALNSLEHADIFASLNQPIHSLRKTDSRFALNKTVLEGSYHDPIMRFRTHEYEATAYLREPVYALNDLPSEFAVEEPVLDTSKRSFSTANLTKILIERIADRFCRAQVFLGQATVDLSPLPALRASATESKTICSIVAKGQVILALDVAMVTDSRWTVSLKAGQSDDLTRPLAGAECILFGPDDRPKSRGFTDANGHWFLDQSYRLLADGDYALQVSAGSNTSKVLLSFVALAKEGE